MYEFKNKFKWPMDMDNRVGGDCGSVGAGQGEKLGKIGTTVIEQ